VAGEEGGRVGWVAGVFGQARSSVEAPRGKTVCRPDLRRLQRCPPAARGLSRTGHVRPYPPHPARPAEDPRALPPADAEQLEALCRERSRQLPSEPIAHLLLDLQAQPALSRRRRAPGRQKLAPHSLCQEAY